MATTSQNHMIVNIHTNIHGHFSGKNQNLTKSYDKGHAHKYSWQLQNIKFRITQNHTKSYDNGHEHKYSWSII